MTISVQMVVMQDPPPIAPSPVFPRTFLFLFMPVHVDSYKNARHFQITTPRNMHSRHPLHLQRGQHKSRLSQQTVRHKRPRGIVLKGGAGIQATHGNRLVEANRAVARVCDKPVYRVIVRPQRRAPVVGRPAAQQPRPQGLEDGECEEGGARALEVVGADAGQRDNLPPRAGGRVGVAHERAGHLDGDVPDEGAQRDAVGGLLGGVVVGGRARQPVPGLHEAREEPAERAAPDVGACAGGRVGPGGGARPVVAVDQEGGVLLRAAVAEELDLVPRVGEVGARQGRHEGQQREHAVQVAPFGVDVVPQPAGRVPGLQGERGVDGGVGGAGASRHGARVRCERRVDGGCEREAVQRPRGGVRGVGEAGRGLVQHRREVAAVFGLGGRVLRDGVFKRLREDAAFEGAACRARVNDALLPGHDAVEHSRR